MKFDFLKGTDGTQSSKRLFTLILIALWVIYFFANLFFGKVLKDSVENNLFYMVLIFYTGVSAETLWPMIFGKKAPTDPADNTKKDA